MTVEDFVITEETLQAPTIEFEDAVDSPIVTDTPVSQPKQTFFVGQVSETIREAQEKAK